MQQGVPPPAPMATPGGRSGIGSAGFILGLIGLILICLGLFIPYIGFVGLILAILGVIFGAIAYWGHWKDKLGLAGFIMGLVGIIVFIIIPVSYTHLRAHET